MKLKDVDSSESLSENLDKIDPKEIDELMKLIDEKLKEMDDEEEHEENSDN